MMAKEYSFWVYILKCNDGMYYTGFTNDLDRRISEHNMGINTDCFTYKRRPVTLVYEQWFSDVFDAIAWEKQIKGWSRKKKEALIRNDIAELKQLSSSRRARDEGSQDHPSSSSG